MAIMVELGKQEDKDDKNVAGAKKYKQTEHKHWIYISIGCCQLY